jgi:hypothetical protein
MNTPRETIYAALYALVSGSAAFATTSRKLEHWSDVGPEEHPALFQRQLDEDRIQQRGLPSKVKLNVELYVYVHTLAQQLAPGVAPSQILNPLLDTLDACFPVDDQGNYVQTLGGLVSHCWIDGKTEIFEGVIGDQAVAIVPVAILVPA